MENKNLVHTEFVHGPGKTFYLDLKKSNNGRNYLVITQSRKVDEEHRERTSIVLFENEINRFSEAMSRSLIQFSMLDEEGQDTLKYPRTFTRWTEADEQKLTQLYSDGAEVTDICVSLKRNAPAITARLKKLGLIISEETIATA